MPPRRRYRRTRTESCSWGTFRQIAATCQVNVGGDEGKPNQHGAQMQKLVSGEFSAQLAALQGGPATLRPLAPDFFNFFLTPLFEFHL